MFFLIGMEPQGLSGQGSGWNLRITLLDQDSTFLQENDIQYKRYFKEKEEVFKQIQEVRWLLADESYMTASVDSMELNGRMYTAYLNVGDAFRWASLERGNVEDALLNKVGFRERLYNGKPFYYKELTQLIQSIQNYAENHGYPFASVGLDSIRILDDNSIYGQLYLKKNALITYEGIEIIGDDVRISKKYLEHYLGIEKGEVYNLEQIKQIPIRIRELPFLRQKKNAVVSFRGTGATINLFLEKRKASKFDFLVGVLPRNQSTGSRLLITVDGMFSTQNLLGGGEKIHLEFRQVRPETQRLDLELGYPYVAGLPFGVEGDFALYKRDSTFLDVEYDIGMSYLFSARHYIKAFGHSKQSILLVVDEEKVQQTRQLPQNLDTRFNDFGLEYHIEDLDYIFNPRKGWTNTTRVAAGFRTIKKNNDIINLVDPLEPDFRYESLYDTFDTRTIQYQLDNRLEGYIPFYPKQRGVFLLANSTGAILSSQPVFLNEQYRLGGTKTLRGFDEEAINASLFSIFTLEYRFIIGRNSYIYLFGDYGYVQSRLTDGKISDTPLGFGAGLAFDTNIGVFGLSTAYGRQQNNPVDFRSAKIHFGYINYF